MADTMEQRAARVLQQAAELKLDFAHRDSARWHSLITAEIVGALCEARDRCINTTDRIRIGELIVGRMLDPNPQPEDRREQPRNVDPIAQAIADLPPGSGGAIPCVICGGDPERKRGCPGCHGAGIHTVSQAVPEGNVGTLAVKPCGCAVDWVGDGIATDFLDQRRKIWNDLGYRTEAAPWTEELRQRLTDSAGCQHGKGAA